MAPVKLALMLLCFIQGCHSQSAGCGVAPSNTRIVGGQDAIPDSWPWQASIIINGDFSCGGSVISEKWVLTAAHCIDLRDFNNTRIRLGVHNRSASNPNEVTVGLSRIACHPGYNPFTYDNDICLLELDAKVSFTPVCLPSNASTFHANVSTWITGFGRTFTQAVATVLQEVNVPIVGNNRCNCYYSGGITENMVCAGLEQGGKDSCQGDSGGPMVTKLLNGAWVQVGIVSFGEGCGLAMRPGVYARASMYQSWIRDQVGVAGAQFVTYTSPGIDPDEFFTCPGVTPFTPLPPTSPHTFNPPPGCNDMFCPSFGVNLMHFANFAALGVFGLLAHVYVGAAA